MRVEIDNVREVIEKPIKEDGRIYGLKKYAGYKAKVAVLEKKEEK